MTVQCTHVEADDSLSAIASRAGLSATSNCVDRGPVAASTEICEICQDRPSVLESMVRRLRSGGIH